MTGADGRSSSYACCPSTPGSGSGGAGAPAAAPVGPVHTQEPPCATSAALLAPHVANTHRPAVPGFALAGRAAGGTVLLSMSTSQVLGSSHVFTGLLSAAGAPPWTGLVGWRPAFGLGGRAGAGTER